MSPPASATTPTTTSALKPKISEGRLEGTFKIHFVLLKNTVKGSVGKSGRWKFTPLCASGTCDVKMRSLSSNYEVRLALVKGSYQGTVKRSGYYKCVHKRLPTSETLDVQVTGAKEISAEWTASEIGGTVEYRALTLGGCVGKAYKKDAIRGKRIGDGQAQ